MENPAVARAPGSMSDYLNFSVKIDPFFFSIWEGFSFSFSPPVMHGANTRKPVLISVVPK